MKRFLVLALCLCLLLASAVVPASAAQQKQLLPFTDASSIRHQAECAIFYDLGVIAGRPDGSFDPARRMSRAEVAVLVTMLTAGAPLETKSPAVDVYEGHWAAGYIAYALQKGYLTCQADGRFQPDLLVSARDFCCVLLRAIGYSDLTADQLEELVMQCGLLSGYTGTLDSFITRDDACLLMYNAVCCYEIAERRDGVAYYYTDELLNPVTFLEHRFGVVRYSEVVTANEYADLSTVDGKLEQGYTKLAEHRAFQVSTDISFVGRQVDIFVKGDTMIGMPRISTDEACGVFPSVEVFRKFLETSAFSTNSQTQYYLNYDASDANCLNASYDRCEITAVDYNRDNVLDTVLLTAYRKATVSADSPLALVFADGTTSAVEQAAGNTAYKAGSTVYAACIAGIWHILAEE